ncbi:MAG TPA: metallophosphoesterase [Stellaceae bacterium]|nr:metallophosphoesterase [Stellaceae bacterium]
MFPALPDMWFGRALIVGLALFQGAALGAARPADAAQYAYVQLGPEGTPLARVVTDAAACPNITLNGVEAGMTVRAAAAPPAFPVTTCEAYVPAGVTSARVGDDVLPIPVAEPKRIIVIGDTGCRLKDDQIQACNVAAEWPFFDIASTAAQMKPDLVIHVGDYHYRETPCPAGDARCQPSPYGDSWAAWQADFFEPAVPLLAAAPWITVRGNHEDCDRAGAGWFRLMEPRRMPTEARAPACTDMTAPYWVPIGRETAWVFDSAAAQDYKTRPAQIEAYRRQWATMTEGITGPSWLLTHKPIWGIAAAGMLDGKTVITELNPTLQQAADGNISPNLFTVISGHVHTFQAVDFQGSRPSQLIVGNSGDALSKPVAQDLAGIAIDDMPTTNLATYGGFGFVLLERTDEGWNATLYDRLGVKLRRCQMHFRNLACAAG